MAPLTNLVSLLPFLGRSPQRPSYSPYVTITTELQGFCRTYADSMYRSVHQFGGGVQLNATCWTTSTMQDNKGRLNQNEGSFTWLWIDLNGEWGPPSIDARPGVGNVDQGGKAGGDGCWLHEDSAREGEQIDFTEALQYCGKAPHHQVGFYFGL